MSTETAFEAYGRIRSIWSGYTRDWSEATGAEWTDALKCYNEPILTAAIATCRTSERPPSIAAFVAFCQAEMRRRAVEGPDRAVIDDAHQALVDVVRKVAGLDLEAQAELLSGYLGVVRSRELLGLPSRPGDSVLDSLPTPERAKELLMAGIEEGRAELVARRVARGIASAPKPHWSRGRPGEPRSLADTLLASVVPPTPLRGSTRHTEAFPGEF